MTGVIDSVAGSGTWAWRNAAGRHSRPYAEPLAGTETTEVYCDLCLLFTCKSLRLDRAHDLALAVASMDSRVYASSS